MLRAAWKCAELRQIEQFISYKPIQIGSVFDECVSRPRVVRPEPGSIRLRGAWRIKSRAAAEERVSRYGVGDVRPARVNPQAPDEAVPVGKSRAPGHSIWFQPILVVGCPGNVVGAWRRQGVGRVVARPGKRFLPTRFSPHLRHARPSPRVISQWALLAAPRLGKAPDIHSHRLKKRRKSLPFQEIPIFFARVTLS